MKHGRWEHGDRFIGEYVDEAELPAGASFGRGESESFAALFEFEDGSPDTDLPNGSDSEGPEDE